MIRHTVNVTPKLVDYESPKLVALVKGFEPIHVIKVTQYDLGDEGSVPSWQTACSEAWSIDPEDIVWWAYADEVKELIEQQD